VKTGEHVEYLLRQGKKPVELVELGFSRRIVTRVSRRLTEEKRASRLQTEKSKARESHSQSAPTSETALVPPELGSLEGKIRQLESRVKVLEKFGGDLGVNLEKIETRINGTPALDLKHRFKCDCGASGYVAVCIRCTKCGRETWWGWHPEQ
jgi:hypothetical protein